MPELDEPTYKQLVDDLRERLADFINRRIIGAMDSSSVELFIQLLDQQPVDEMKVQSFINIHVPDKERVTMDAMLEFRTLYLGK